MSSGSQNLGKWSNPIAGVGPRRSQPAYTVPDDWDSQSNANEDDKDNKHIWEEANSKAPMPQIVISGSRSTAPPPTAFAPTMKILKRPQSASPKPGGSAAQQKTLAEREADYKAARERIFASNPSTPSPSSPAGSASSSSGLGTKNAGIASTDKTPSFKSSDRTDKQPDTVVRQPRGPGSTGSRGFGNRRAQAGSRGGTPGGSGTQSPTASQASSPRTQTPAPSSHLEKRS